MNESISALQPTTDRHLGAVFFRRVRQLGERTFIKLERNGRFEDVSWRRCGALVESLIFSLRALGLAPGDAVAIIGDNSLEWLCADLATLASGLPNVVLSPSLSDAMLLRVLDHAECRAAFAQDACTGRLVGLKKRLARLAHVIAMGREGESVPGTIPFARLAAAGGGGRDALDAVLGSVRPGDLATIMYTSGSTGAPKGVMKTQDNLLSNITNGGELVPSRAEELFLIVLSLNHLFGRFGFHKSAVTGRTTALVEATERQVDLDVVQSLAPTALAVVPRVMARLWEQMLEREGLGGLWEKLESLDRERADGSASSERPFEDLKAALGPAVRRALGGRIKYISYGGAAMPPRIMRFFELAGVPLIGSYGSTECGGVTLCGIGENRPGNLGRPFPNVELRIAGDGEILVRGPTVTPGYWRDPEATREALDPDGWFHTGDLGVLQADGSLRVVGRKKDIFNCSDGTNIYPGAIEALLENDPFIRQAVLVGDGRPFIGALLVPERARIAAACGRDPASLSRRDVEAALRERIEAINSGLEHYERIRGFCVLDADFPPDARSVSAFQKVTVRRAAVEELYRNEIAEIYSARPEGEGK
ncbi:MAG TPA: AMP-binding protein [candidate division Zixibacteria bacterium]|nr:AMP-binding protein [candidate division Zixibacteria bacterium]